MHIDVYHDTVCPWCRIGLHNLAKALEGWQGPAVTVRLRPFLLDPDSPPEGYDLREHLAAKYGAVDLEPMFERVTQAGARIGVKFDFAKVTRMPDTRLSHVLIEAAGDALALPVAEALHKAYFEEGRDISADKVLLEAAVKGGMDKPAARAAITACDATGFIRSDARAATRKGVRAVPHFVIGRQVLTGAQPVEVLRAALQEAAGTADLAADQPACE